MTQPNTPAPPPEERAPSEPRKCACPRFVTRRECIDIRYGRNEYDEGCECICHDEADDEQD